MTVESSAVPAVLPAVESPADPAVPDAAVVSLSPSADDVVAVLTRHERSSSTERTPRTAYAASSVPSGSASGVWQVSVPSWPENLAVMPAFPATASSAGTRRSRSSSMRLLKMGAPTTYRANAANPPRLRTRRR